MKPLNILSSLLQFVMSSVFELGPVWIHPDFISIVCHKLWLEVIAVSSKALLLVPHLSLFLSLLCLSKLFLIFKSKLYEIELPFPLTPCVLLHILLLLELGGSLQCLLLLCVLELSLVEPKSLLLYPLL